MQRKLKTTSDQKLFEQRRKQVAYSLLNRSLGLTSIFDFFSQDAFTIVLNAKLFAQKSKTKLVHNEMLLISAVNSDLSMSQILQSYNLDRYLLEKVYSQYVTKKEPALILNHKIFARKIIYILDKVLNFLATIKISLLNKDQYQPQPKFSEACLFLFEQAAQNAQKQFHTPVISADILVFTMMENKQLKIGQIFLSALKDQLEWLMLRYQLIKRIYAQEAGIREQLKTNHFYYLYLLKTQITDSKYDAICKNESLEHKALVLRTVLIKRALKTNLAKQITNLIVHRPNKRKYLVS